MKIIGKTEDGFIIQAESNELANMVGYYSEYYARDTKSPLEVGRIYPISALYKQATETIEAYKEIREQFTKVSNSLSKLLAQISPAPGDKSK